MNVGYLGPSGTYCQEAMNIFGKTMENYSEIEFSTIYDVLNAVKNKQIEYAVVPIENSIEGSVNVTLDVLAETADLKVSGEIILPIRHNLLVRRGTKVDDIELILSHPQALAQCTKYLIKNFPDVDTRAALSTAEGARAVAESNRNWAAIGNAKSASVYNLEITTEGIQDDENNATRFVVVSFKDSVKTGKDKTSIIFSTEDRPGSLYRVLDIFNLWDINLTRIESRPAKNELGKYIFFVDIEGHREEPDVRDALTMVNRKASYFRILGSYPCLN